MPECMLTLFIVPFMQFKSRVSCDRTRKIPYFTINSYRKHFLCKSFRYILAAEGDAVQAGGVRSEQEVPDDLTLKNFCKIKYFFVSTKVFNQ